MSIAKRVLINQDREGMLKRSLERIIQLYTDKSHFIYELLQNAEDARASRILFLAKQDKLEVFHDGMPFTQENLAALCDIGKSDKAEDLNKIGEFGVGFKSVFGICKEVLLYSQPKKYEGAESFAVKIEDFTRPIEIAQAIIPHSFTTKFVFPYCVAESFSGFKTMSALRKAISDRLTTLGYNTLLFMHHLQSIEYQIEIEGSEASGTYSIARVEYSENCSKVYSGDKADQSESHYLVYSKQVPGMPSRTVNIAYYVTKDKEGKESFSRPKDPYISVFFPTETESKLDFIVQGPFRTTPNRSSIPFDDEDNVELAKLIAELMYESVLDIKKRGDLDLSFLSLLPLNSPDRIDNWLFSPLLFQVKRLFIEENVLPTSNGDFTNVNHAVIARGQELTRVFTGSILNDLLDRYEDTYDILYVNHDDETISWYCTDEDYTPQHSLIPYKWIDTRLTENTYPVLHRFLSYDLDVSVIRPENIAELISRRASFFMNRDDDWIEVFYRFLHSQSKSSDIFNMSRHSSKSMLLTPFVKTTNNTFVAPYKEEGNWPHSTLRPNVFLQSSMSIEGLNYINSELLNKFPELFKETLSLKVPDEFSYFLIHFRESYQQDGAVVKWNQHLDDIKRVLTFLDDSNHRHPMVSALKDASFILCADGKLRNPYRTTISLEKLDANVDANQYFPPKSIYIVSDYYIEHELSTESLSSLGVLTTLWINTEPLGWHESWSDARVQVRDAYGFSSRLDLFQCANVLEEIRRTAGSESSRTRSKILFDLLCSQEENLQGSILVGKVAQSKEEVDCLLVQRLKSYNPWLYTFKNELVDPSDISKYELDTELYGAVQHGREIYNILDFKITEQDEKNDTVVQALSGDLTTKRELFSALVKELYGVNIRDFEASFPQSPSFISSDTPLDDYFSLESEFDDFPIRPIADVQRLVKMVEDNYFAAEPVQFEEKLRRIRISIQPERNRAYLKSMYSYDSETTACACQMCEMKTLYPRAVQIEREMTLELPSMFLFLCPNCAEIYREVRNDISVYKSFISALNDEDVLSGDEPFRIRFKNGTIAFTATHLFEVQQNFNHRKRLRQLDKKPEKLTNKKMDITETEEKIAAVSDSNEIIPGYNRNNVLKLLNSRVLSRNYGVGSITKIEVQESKIMANVEFASKSTAFDLGIALRKKALVLLD